MDNVSKAVLAVGLSSLFAAGMEPHLLFSEGELRRAFVLVMDIEEATRLAKQLSRPVNDTQPVGGMLFDEETLMLLTFGEDSTAAKVERLRENLRNGQPEAEEERRAWHRRREAMRQALEAEGKLPD